MPEAPSTVNRLKSALRSGEPTLGLIVTMPSVQVVQTLASADVDWIIIDVARTPEQARAMVDRGYKANVFGFDWSLLQQSASRFIELAKGQAFSPFPWLCIG